MVLDKSFSLGVITQIFFGAPIGSNELDIVALWETSVPCTKIPFLSRNSISNSVGRDATFFGKELEIPKKQTHRLLFSEAMRLKSDF